MEAVSDLETGVPRTWAVSHVTVNSGRRGRGGGKGFNAGSDRGQTQRADQDGKEGRDNVTWCCFASGDEQGAVEDYYLL